MVIITKGGGSNMNNTAKEGDLYKSVTVFGKTFELYYGYYEEYERHSKFNEPVPIYPNFKDEPQYTENGCPFVTEMQAACEHYKGKPDEHICYGCEHFGKGDELIGICKLKQKR